MLQPGLQQSALVGGMQALQDFAVELIDLPSRHQLLEGHVNELALLVALLGQGLAEIGQASCGAGMKSLEHRQHFMAHPVAAEACIAVARIQPDRQLKLTTDAAGVLTAKAQQWTH